VEGDVKAKRDQVMKGSAEELKQHVEAGTR